MDVYMIALVLGGGAALGVIVWVLAKLGKALIKIAEALAAAAVVCAGRRRELAGESPVGPAPSGVRSRRRG